MFPREKREILGVLQSPSAPQYLSLVGATDRRRSNRRGEALASRSRWKRPRCNVRPLRTGPSARLRASTGASRRRVSFAASCSEAMQARQCQLTLAAWSRLYDKRLLQRTKATLVETVWIVWSVHWARKTEARSEAVHYTRLKRKVAVVVPAYTNERSRYVGARP